MRKLGFLGLCCAVAFASAGVAAEKSADQYIVRFEKDINITRAIGHKAVVSQLQQQLERSLGAVKKSVGIKPLKKLWISNSIVAQLTKEEAKKVAGLKNVAEVKPVERKRYIDPDIDKREVRSEPSAVQWSIKMVKAPEVWEKFKIDGSGIVVGHIDTGIYAEHPALKGKTLAFKDFTAAKKTEAYDDQGHGTHTAGSIAGGDGVGVAPGARLIVAKVFDKNGSGDDASILESMQWIMDPDGNPETNDAPLLVSNSWGSDDTADKGFWEAVNAWVAAGIVPVFAAGNNGPSGKVGTPGNFPHSWAVAATTNKDGLAYFSSIGPIVWDGVTLTKPDIAAPGQGVISCSTSGGLVSDSGTSMACPHVAGLVALMLQANPKLTIEQVRTIAESTAVDLGTAGKDNKFGSGRFDAEACLKKVLESASLVSAFQAYESALLSEKALIGVQATAPLSAPLARSIVERARTMDEGEFLSLQKTVAENGNEASQKLLKDAIASRQAETLHQ